MDGRDKPGHDDADVICVGRIVKIITSPQDLPLMSDTPARTNEYGVTPTEIMASMPGLDFVRAIFSGQLPEPPIMQTVEPFDCTAEPGVVVIHSFPGFRHYNPIGSVHGGYAATLLDSAMGLAVHSMLPAGTGYTTLEFKLSFIRGMTKDSGKVRTEGRTLHVGRRTATAEARITDAKGRLLAHATTTCLVFEIPKESAKESATGA